MSPFFYFPKFNTTQNHLQTLSAVHGLEGKEQIHKAQVLFIGVTRLCFQFISVEYIIT